MLKFFLYFIFIYSVLFLGRAYAYLDPGTGSIIIQAIIGFIAAGIAAISIYWQKFKNLLKKTFKKDNKIK
jgi:high-affinity Fe2+/Pb2+ permease